MGDSTDNYSSGSDTSQNDCDDEGCSASARRRLKMPFLDIDDALFPWISDHVDCFVSQSRGNKSMEYILLYSCLFTGRDEVWEKVGQAIGNLQSLATLQISPNQDYERGVGARNEVIPDWERLACILRHVRQNVTVVVDDERLRTIEELQPFARAICEHPTIISFEDSGMFPYASLDTLYSALATLPALESIILHNHALHTRPEDEYSLANPGSLTELLRVPSLRSFCFRCFNFTLALCKATANALMKGTVITNLDFKECSFPVGECASILVNGFSKNTSVTSIKVASPWDQALNGALGAALPLNSTLQELVFALSSDDRPVIHVDWPPIFLALRENTGLKSLKVAVCESMDESLSTAIKDGLGMNETLVTLELNNISLRDDNSELWCRALSFLRTNNALKSLTLNLDQDVTRSCCSAFRIDVATILQENVSLESLSIRTKGNKFEAEEYIALVAALEHNTTLKTFSLRRYERLQLSDDEIFQFSNDEDKEMALTLKKNYALERLPDVDLEDGDAGDVGAILRLNAAGRRYLIEDGSSISKGVEVLSSVNHSITCVFLHLLENPRLCDRSAMEMVITGENTSWSSSPNGCSGGEKREQISAQKSKESRRRLV